MDFRGPYHLYYGGTDVSDVSDLSFDYSPDTQEYTNLLGNKRKITTGASASVSAKVLRSDIPTLAAMLPQYFVAMGEVLSSGETVTNTEGAIDVDLASCSAITFTDDLLIVDCTGTQAMRYRNVETRIDGQDNNDNALLTWTVVFEASPQSGAPVQLLGAGDFSIES